MGTTYSVLEWGSHPDADNDDCWTGQDTRDLAEATRIFDAPPSQGTSTAYVVLCVSEDPDSTETVDDPSIYRIRKTPGHKPYDPTEDDRAWQQEIANQAGMMGGCDAYNEVMGYDYE